MTTEKAISGEFAALTSVFTFSYRSKNNILPRTINRAPQVVRNQGVQVVAFRAHVVPTYPFELMLKPVVNVASVHFKCLLLDGVGRPSPTFKNIRAVIITPFLDKDVDLNLLVLFDKV